MKKLFSILIFLSIVSCSVESTSDQGFLDLVKGKDIYEAGKKYHDFSSDGRKLTIYGGGYGELLEVVSDNKGIYYGMFEGDAYVGIYYGGENSILYMSSDKSELFTDRIPGDTTDVSIK